MNILERLLLVAQPTADPAEAEARIRVMALLAEARRKLREAKRRDGFVPDAGRES